jgi:replicative DNA helicase
MPQLFIGQHLQDSLCRLMITDPAFLRAVAGVIEPSLFSSRYSETVADLCVQYYNAFHVNPGDHFHDELLQKVTTYSDDDKTALVQYVGKLAEMPAPNAQYALRRVGDFIKIRRREQAAIRFAELLAKGETEKADLEMYSALKSGIAEEDTGLQYFRDFSFIERRASAPEFLIPTGIDALDSLVGGYQRGQLVSILGSAKGMKTWSMMQIAMTGLLAGKRVLWISHECTRDEMELRFDMMYSGRGSRRIGQTAFYPVPSKTPGQVERIPVEIRSVYDHNAVLAARRAVMRWGGDLIIQKYPMGQCTMGEVNRYLNYLETFENWVPDILINDYVDIMNLGEGGDQTRHDLNAGYIWMKGIADKMNILVVTASQARREAIQKRSAGMKDFAEDIRKAGNIDFGLAICRTQEQAQCNTANAVVIASRSGVMDVSCGFSYCLDIGQVCMASWPSRAIDDEAFDVMRPESKKETA